MIRTEFKGYWGEFFAICLLKIKGYSLLAHRYKTYVGEIDIVAKRKNEIVFIEVKARKDEEKCHIAITQKQLRRVQNASQIFLKRNPQFQDYAIRYDVILISDWSLPLHIENITI